jgi:hypothetical protein
MQAKVRTLDLGRSIDVFDARERGMIPARSEAEQ